jgi:predicted Fe-Mo cluster-binding NifX family protein
MRSTAITLWNGIVSPVFDAANTFLIVNSDATRETVRIDASSSIEMARALKARNIAVVICGAISAMPLRLLMQNGISVISCIRGNVEEVIEAYQHGVLNSRPFLMPGCGRFGCNGMGRGRCRGRMRRRTNVKRRYP